MRLAVGHATRTHLVFPLILEDRIVKHRFRYLSKNCSLLRVLTKKTTVAQADEIQHNSRARSAKLRFALTHLGV